MKASELTLDGLKRALFVSRALRPSRPTLKPRATDDQWLAHCRALGRQWRYEAAHKVLFDELRRRCKELNKPYRARQDAATQARFDALKRL